MLRHLDRGRPDIQRNAVAFGHQLGGERADALFGDLWLAALGSGPLETVRRSPLFDILGPERMFTSLEDAVKAYLARHAGAATAADGNGTVETGSN